MRANYKVYLMDVGMKEAKELKGGKMKEIEGRFKITMNVDDIVGMTDDIFAILKIYTKGGAYSLKTLPIEGVK